MITGCDMVDYKFNLLNTQIFITYKDSNFKAKWGLKAVDFVKMKVSNYDEPRDMLTGDSCLSTHYMTDDIILVVTKCKESNIDNLNIYLFKTDALFHLVHLSDKTKKDLKFSHFLPSPNKIHFIIGCLDGSLLTQQ